MKQKTENKLAHHSDLAGQKRWQTFWHDYEWPLVLTVGLISLILGYVGLAKNAAATGQSLSPLDLVYRTLQLLTMESGAVSGPVSWELEIARFLVPVLAAYAAAKAFAMLFREQLQLARLWFIQDHVLICGLGQMGYLLVEQFRQRGQNVVVIEQDEDNSLLTVCRERGAIVLIGDATDTTLLRKAATLRARHLISVCGDDGLNTEVALHAQQLTRERTKGVLTCTIHIVDPQISDLLREEELGTAQFSTFRLQLFNIFDRGARLLLQEYPPYSKTDQIPHILVVGLGNLGANLIINAAKTWQEAQPSLPQRLRITAIDKEVTWKLESLRLRYPPLDKVCQFLPHPIDIHSPEFQRADFLRADQEQYDVDTVYICLDDDSLGLHTGLALLRQMRQRSIPIIIRMAEQSGLATLLHHQQLDDKGTFKNLHSFGLLNYTCTPELVLGGTNEILARALHEEYVHQQEQAGQTIQTNPALAEWDKLPETLKESNRRQVDHIRGKFDAIGIGIYSSTDWDIKPLELSTDEVEIMARLEHERWLDERRQEGWQYAPGPKNLQKKTNPDLVPWEKLSDEGKAWNRNTVRELPTFLTQAGFQMYRLEE